MIFGTSKYKSRKSKVKFTSTHVVLIQIYKKGIAENCEK